MNDNFEIEEENEIPQVHINPINCPFNDIQKTHFESLVHPLQIDILRENSTVDWNEMNHALVTYDLVIQEE